VFKYTAACPSLLDCRDSGCPPPLTGVGWCSKRQDFTLSGWYVSTAILLLLAGHLMYNGETPENCLQLAALPDLSAALPDLSSQAQANKQHHQCGKHALLYLSHYELPLPHNMAWIAKRSHGQGFTCPEHDIQISSHGHMSQGCADTRGDDWTCNHLHIRDHAPHVLLLHMLQ